MKNSEVLKKARELLWDGVEYPPREKEEFICLAVGEVCNIYNNLLPTVSNYGSICDRINEKLKGSDTLESYLSEHEGVETSLMTTQQIQNLRFEFIDQLISEYEAEGK